MSLNFRWVCFGDNCANIDVDKTCIFRSCASRLLFCSLFTVFGGPQTTNALEVRDMARFQKRWTNRSWQSYQHVERHPLPSAKAVTSQQKYITMQYSFNLLVTVHKEIEWAREHGVDRRTTLITASSPTKIRIQQIRPIVGELRQQNQPLKRSLERNSRDVIHNNWRMPAGSREWALRVTQRNVWLQVK